MKCETSDVAGNLEDIDDDDLIIIKKVLQKGNHIHRLTALLEHGKFRAGH